MYVPCHSRQSTLDGHALGDGLDRENALARSHIRPHEVAVFPNSIEEDIRILDDDAHSTRNSAEGKIHTGSRGDKLWRYLPGKVMSFGEVYPHHN